MKKMYLLLYPFLLKRKIKLLSYILLTGILGYCTLVVPVLNGRLFDLLVESGQRETLYAYVQVILGILFISLILSYIIQHLYVSIQAKTAYELNIIIISNIQNQSLNYLCQSDPVYSTRLINEDVNQVTTFAVTIIQDVITNLAKVLIPLIAFFRYNIFLGIFLAVIFIIYYFAFLFLKKGLYFAKKELTEKNGEFFSLLCEPFIYRRLYKIYEIAQKGFPRLNSLFQTVLKKSRRMQKQSWLFSATDQIIGTLSQLFIVVIGGILVINGDITIGILTLLLSYFHIFLNAIKYFYSLGGNYQSILVSCNRLYDHFSCSKCELGVKRISSLQEISVSNLSFSYGKKSTYFHFPDMKFMRGQIYAIVGDNGIGKSTFVSLIAGLYMNYYEGEIRINGIDIQEVNMTKFRLNNLAYVDQNAVILNDTIVNNILLFDMSHSIEDILALNSSLGFFPPDIAAHIFCNDESQSGIPCNLSGGELQKISILRALIKNADFIILDEPTNCLDEQSESRLFKYLETIKTEKIIVIISHSPTVKKLCDQMYEL